MKNIFVCQLDRNIQKQLLKRVNGYTSKKSLLSSKILELNSIDICTFEEMENLRNKGGLK